MNVHELFIFDRDDLVAHPYLNEKSDILNLPLEQPKGRLSPTESLNYCLNIMPRRSFYTDKVRNMDLKIQHYKNSPITKDDFHIVLDVHHFKPDEIKVKVVDDHVVVTGKHEIRRDDHGWVSRQFTRKYPLPKNVNVDDLTCKLSSNSLLMIVAPKTLKDETVRTLPIEYTGKPFMNKNKEKLKTFQQSDEEKK